MGSPEYKELRQKRRKNHIQKDLRTSKYHQRIVKQETYDRNKLKRIDIEINNESEDNDT